MKKRVIYVVLVAIMLVVAGCRKKSIIPDDVLAEIFHDAFVTNAYIGEERVNLDSLQVYEAIFTRYGYTTQDVVYTVGNFSRRKSARLGTVVEMAISRLESESKLYSGKVVILDTIRNVAERTFTKVVHKDTLIKASKRADTTALQLTISPIPKGEYTITYNYKCNGDLDKHPRRMEAYFIDESGFRHGYVSATLRNYGMVNRTIVAREDQNKLIVDLGTLESKSKRYPKDHDISIKNLKIVHRLKDEDAVVCLFEQYVDNKIFVDGFPFKKDSLALSADSTGVSTSSARNR